MDLPGMSAWLRHQADEEIVHANKFIDHVADRDNHPVIGAMQAPQVTASSVLDAFKAALAHEQKVSESIRNLYRAAEAEGDLDSRPLLNWFLEEQIEEEATVSEIVGRLVDDQRRRPRPAAPRRGARRRARSRPPSPRPDRPLTTSASRSTSGSASQRASIRAARRAASSATARSSCASGSRRPRAVAARRPTDRTVSSWSPASTASRGQPAQLQQHERVLLDQPADLREHRQRVRARVEPRVAGAGRAQLPAVRQQLDARLLAGLDEGRAAAARRAARRSARTRRRRARRRSPRRGRPAGARSP